MNRKLILRVLGALLGIEAEQNHVEIYVTPSMFEGIIRTNSEIWHIDQDGYVWKGDER